MDLLRTRLTLLQRIQAGDEGGWVEFYELYRPMILWVARSRGVDHPESRDLLVQSVMRHFATHPWTHDPEKGQFRSLLMRVASNKLFEVLREIQPLHSRQLKGRDAPDARPRGTDPAEIAGGGEGLDTRQESVDRGIARMMADEEINPRHLQVLLLSLEGLKLQEISGRTGLSLVNVKVTRHRMLARLREMIKGEEER
ncbi:MAG: hypothetical protein RL095_1702 [Verrucomicrobiota bacterium]|jgi:RNA polymerase sigma-70 factor (ECF subfamily)